MSRAGRPAGIAAWARAAPAAFLMAWGGNHFTPLLHMYEDIGGYAPWQANLLLGTYVGGLVPGLLIAAAISDRHGRKPVMLAGLGAAAMGSALLACGLESMWVLCAGRVFAGLSVGVAMSVGTSWIKELSQPPFDLRAGAVAGARRPSLTLTLGFALGAGVTGCLAQWAPVPWVTPYAVHLVLCVPALAALLTAPESRRGSAGAEGARGAWWRDLRVPSAGHRRFLRVIVPAAPWVFAAAGVAYAIVPAVVQDDLGEWTTLYATVLTVVTLGTGAVVQNIVPLINRWTRGRAIVVGLTLMVAGMVLAVVASRLGDPAFGFVVAVVLGAAYGICVIAGLIQVQATATPQDLAGMTGLYYSLTYAGFLLPTLLAALLPVAPYDVSLVVVALACLACLGAVAWESRRHWD